MSSSSSRNNINNNTNMSNNNSSDNTTTNNNNNNTINNVVLIASSFLFSLTAYWFIIDLQKRRQYTIRSIDSQNQLLLSITDNDTSVDHNNHRDLKTNQKENKQDKNGTATEVWSMVSSRCHRAIRIGSGRRADNNNNRIGGGGGVVSTFGTRSSYFITAMQDPCIQNPYDNPTGYVPLCIAENKLITDLISERMTQAGTAENAFSELPTYHYNNFLGMPMARDSASYFLAKRFYKPNEYRIRIEDALRWIHPNNIVIGCGAAPLLHTLFFLLGESGDACLIPAPYYSSFDSDISIVANIIPFPIRNIANVTSGPNVLELDMSYLQAKSAGLNPKFLLLTNPNNPLGTIYPSESIKNMIEWGRKKKLHIIVDEIYALSTHKPNQQHTFKSVIQVLDNRLENDVHMIWALSKDFGASGLRYGLLYTQNKVLLQGISNMNHFHSVSCSIQYMVSELLTDDVFVDTFLNMTRERLLYSYELCTSKLNEMVIPYIPAEAGLFVYVDFSSLLPQKTFDCERQLTKLLFDARLLLTPGESQHDTTPGMYRICYAWVPPEVLSIALERLSRLVVKIRRMDWEDLVNDNGRYMRSVIEG